MKTNRQSPTQMFSIPPRESFRGELSPVPDQGTPEDGLCYLVTLALSDSLSAEETTRFLEKRREIMERLSEAGLKGARAKVKACSEEWEQYFINEIDPCLNRENGSGGLLPHASEWKTLFQNEPGCQPIELSVRDNHLHALFRWSGVAPLDARVIEWKKQFPGFQWEDGFRSIQISEAGIPSFIHFLQADKNDASPSFLTENKVEVDTTGTAPEFRHITVLLHETVDALQPAPGKVIVDATLGGGGHTELLLDKGATVIGIDQDPDARRAATKRLEKFAGRFRVLSGNFRDVETLLRHEGITQVDGLLADIGVSSHQIDTPERGFSFRENGPLDMRMSPEVKTTAADLVNTLEEAELARIFWEYGEERASRSLARLIVQERKKAPITTTSQLAALAERAIPRKGGHHPGTKIFQALRIYVNDELGALNDLLESSVRVLAPEGKLAVITFHSLEDRCVKRFLDTHSRTEIDRPEWPAPRPNPEYHFTLINKRPIVAGGEETKLNPRSRSAKLRAAQRIL